ncbi:hypothetical protein KCU72_g15321, partial [Aureobasidium melanogenum]
MDYNQLTVAKLKDELKERDIPSTGLKLKKDYIDRLEQHDLDQANQQRNASLETPTEDSATVDPSSTADLPPVAEDKPEPIENQEPAEPAQETVADTAPSHKPEAMDQLPTTATPEPAKTEEPISADGRKRKRRSHSPIITEEVVHKKLKQEADGPVVHLPTDQAPMTNDVSMPDVALEQPDLTLQPMSTSDDLTQPFANDSDKPRSTRSPNERRFKNLINPAESDPVQLSPEPTDVAVSPAIHPATRALYIRDLVRPINSSGLRDHLEDIARPPDHSDSSASLVEECYVDALRTHAFVLFTSISAASRARAGT